MKLTPLNELFHIKYGNQLDLYKLESNENSDINFVSRSRENLGVVCKVSRLSNIEPLPAGLITVTLGGTYLLSSFVQQREFYTAQNIKVLTPKKEMSLNEKIFYCKSIELNRFRYTSHGREANTTLDTLPVPSEAPKEFLNIKVDLSKPAKSTTVLKEFFQLNTEYWQCFRYDQLFTIERGRGARVTDVKEEGRVAFITSTDLNNGLKGFVDSEAAHPANVITVNRNGSVGEAFYQPKPFCSTEDVHVFVPKFNLTPYIAMFLVALIKKEKYRYNYGRKWGLARMNESIIKLPIKNGQPDFEFIENYIKSLPYSGSI
ncbi:MAG TPA: restriction endonuclease subunit S [Pyrinomonadaceae bacterium]|jgi:hypothetical protein